MRSQRGEENPAGSASVLSPRFSCWKAGRLSDFPCSIRKHKKKGRRIRNPPSMLIYSRLICLPVRSPRGHRGACGVDPLSMDSSIAAMTAMRVHAHHAERQVRQPGLVPLPRTIQEYHENLDISIPFPPLVPSLDKLIVATYTRQCCNKSNRTNPIECTKSAIVLSFSPFHVSHNWAKSSYAGRDVDTGGRADRVGWRAGRAADTIDGDDKSGWRDDGASRIDEPSGKQSIRNTRRIRIALDLCAPENCIYRLVSGAIM